MTVYSEGSSVRGGRPARVAVLEPERVPHLVQHRHMVVVAGLRPGTGPAEPDVAARAAARQVGVGRAGVLRVGEADVGRAAVRRRSGRRGR